MQVVWHEIFGCEDDPSIQRRDDRLTYRSVSLKTMTEALIFEDDGSRMPPQQRRIALFSDCQAVFTKVSQEKMAEKSTQVARESRSAIVCRNVSATFYPQQGTHALSTIVERFHLAKGSIIAKMWSLPRRRRRI